MRVTFGEAQFGVHPRDHQIGNGVFEDFGLVVDFVPKVRVQIVVKDEMAKDVVALMKHLGHDRFRLAGHDRDPGLFEDQLAQLERVRGRAPRDLPGGGRRRPRRAAAVPR